MPFGLGFFATAGVSAPAGSYDLLETTLVSGSSTTEILFNNLNTYASTYKHLQIRYVARTSESGTARAMTIRLNGNSGSNYARHILYGTGSGSPVSTSGTSMTFGYVSYMAASSSGTSVYVPGVIDLLDPFETKNKTVRAFSGEATAGPIVALTSVLYAQTASLTSISLYSENLSSAFVSGSRFSLYGIKGA